MTSSIAFDVIARDKASSTFSRIGRSSDSTMKKLARFGRSTAGLVGFTTLTAAAAGFVKVGASYSTSLNKIQALSGVTDGKLKQISSTLEGQSGQFAKMGQTTGDAAGGMVELVKAGLSADKALKAVTQTMVLAKAGEMDIADASSLVANTLNTFGLKARDAGKIANYLANAANISSADVTDLAESMKYVAPVAASTGVSLKQTSAILAELSNSGIAASNAGTGFRKFLLSLQAPSGQAKTDLHDLGVEIFDASGKMKPLGTVIDLLDGKLSKLTDRKRQKILKDVFGLQGISAASVILKGGAKGLETYAKGVSRAGAAQRLAEAQSKGFMGSLRQLRAEAISTAQAAYRKLEPSLDAAAKSLQKFLDQMKTGKGAGGDFVDVLKDLAGVVKTAVSILNGLPGPVKKFGIEGLIAYAVLTKLRAGMTGLSASTALPIARIKQFSAEMTYSSTRMAAVKSASLALGGALRQLGGVGGMLALTDGARRSSSALGALEMTAGGAAAGFAVGGPLGAAVGAAGGYIGALVKEIKSSDRAFSNTLSSAKTYAGTLNEVSAAATRATRAMVLERLEKTGTLAATRKLNISDRDAVQTTLGNAAARKRLTAALRAAVAAGHGYEALKIANALGIETSAINDSRVAQLQKNLALAKTDAQARRIQAKLDKLGRTNATARLLISGADSANRQLTSTEQLIKDIGGSQPTVNVGAKTGKARADLGSFYTYLLSVTKDRTVNVHVKRVKPGKPGGVGDLLGQTSGGGGGRPDGRLMQDAGRSTASAYATGVHLGAMKVKNALDKLQDLVSAAASKLANLKEVRSGFLATFSADSIFGADLSNGGGISSLIAMQQQQATSAAQLVADIQRVASMGLSKSLISQLQAQGTSGAAALHALASGSTAQIAQLNSLNAQTQGSLGSAGMLAGNLVRGGNINSDIGRATRDEQLIERLIKRLHHMDQEIVVEIDGEAIVRAVRRRNKRKGVRSANI